AAAPVRLPYHYGAADWRARYLRALKDKKILGARCSATGKVFVPPLVNSPESLAPADEFVEVADRGVVTTFCIVNIPVIGRALELPYVVASIALDGADISIQAPIQECKPGEVRMGMGVERSGVDYQVGGSADYIDGRPFGFVGALEVMGSWPPTQDLHLEMDAAFAAHYAWIRMQAGDCDTALVCGHGKVSEGEPRRILNLELDPYYQAPTGLHPIATAAPP